MADSPLSILIDIKQRGMEAFKTLEDGLNRADKSGRAYSATMSASAAASNSLAGSVGKLVAVLGSADLYSRAIKSAFQFNSTIEQSQIGIAALIRSFNDFVDVNGNVVDAQKAYALSMDMAAKVQTQLQIAGLKTTATYEQLLKIMQEGLGPAFKAGFNPDQIVQFVSMMAQAGAALAVPMDQLGQEVRAILDGTIDRNARIAKSLGITNQAMKDMIAQGKGFDYLKAKLVDFAAAGDAAAQTFSGALSNLTDAAQMALGSSLSNAFRATTKMILEMQKAIVTIDEKAGTFKFNDKIVAAFAQVDDAIVSILGNGKSVNDWLVTAIQAFSNVAEAVLTFADAAVKILDVIGPILPALTELVTWLGLAKIAFAVLIGMPLALANQIRILLIAMGVLTTGSSFVAWLGTLRAGLVAAAAEATAMANALRATVAVAAAMAAMEIFNLARAVYQYVNANRALKQAQQDLKDTKDFLDPKTADKLKEISAATGLNITSMKEFNKLVAENVLVWNEAKKGWTFNANAATTVKPKDQGLSEKDIQEQTALEKRLSDELIKLSGDKWTVLRNQAKAHYDEDVQQAHGRADLLEKAQKVYNQEMAKIAKDQAEDGQKIRDKSIEKEIRDQEKLRKALADIQEAFARREITESKAISETQLAELRLRYDQEKITLKEYAEERKRILQRNFEIDEAALRQEISVEPDIKKRMELEDQLFAKKEELKRQEISINQEVLDNEKQTALERAQAIAGMYQSMEESSTESFNAQVALLDEQKKRYQKLKIDQLVIEKWYQDELEKLQRQQALKSDSFSKGFMQAQEDNEKALRQSGQRGYDFYMGIMSDMKSAWSGFFDDLIDNKLKTAGDYFTSFAKSIAKTWFDLVSEMIARWMMLMSVKGMSSFFGLFGSSTSMTGMNLVNPSGAAIGFAGGGQIPGYSPTSKSDNILIRATAKEFIQPVDTVRHYGLDIMEALRRKLIPKSLFAGWSLSMPSPSSFALASGGSVPDSGGFTYNVSVPVSVTGISGADKLSKILPGEIEQTVIRVVREQLR